jgi:uncharacterized repeat protein (TIGR01451 family)
MQYHFNKSLTLWLLIFSLLLSLSVDAKSPVAGTLVQNQASATYKDADGVEQTATSNVVATSIQQVGAMELVQNQMRLGVAGNTVYLPHVLTNTGNGVDSYDFILENVAADDYDFDLSKVLIYEDKDKDGLPDNSTSITSTNALANDEAFYLVLAAEIPASVTNNQLGKLKLKGISMFVETPVDLVIERSNTDTVTVSDDAVVNVVKRISANAGASSSGAYTVTLAYENKGRVTATNVILSDSLPTGMIYNPNSARWIETGSVLVLSDNNDVQGSGLNTVKYCAYSVNCSSEVSAIISKVAAGDSGHISFEVNIAAGLSATTLINIAEFAYNNGSSVISAAKTNQVPFEVLQLLSVVANGSTTNAVDGADNKGGTTSDSFIVDIANRGATVAFDNMIRNTGNGDDVFDIRIDEVNASFPSGTVFQLLQSDGFTPLMDSNNNGVVDTGILGVNEAYKVVLKAILPVNASGNNGGTGFKVMKTAISSLDNTVFNSVTDHLVAITVDSVDLTNNVAIAAGARARDGVGIGPETNAITTNNVVSGGKVVFRLFINNTSSTSGSYELQYSTKKPFDAGVIESGWGVSFHQEGGNGDCSTQGVASSTTTSIVAGGSQQMCAVVTAPTNAIGDGKEHPFYFKVYSRLTGAFDIKHDAVRVVEQPALSMAPDQIGQIAPGGSVVYSHQITNNGNTALECIRVTALDLDPQSGWSSVLYMDVNGDSQLDARDTPLANQILNVGQSLPVLIKLFAPTTVAMGIKNIQTLTVTGHQDDADSDPTTCTGAVLTGQVQDVTKVSTSKMAIMKEQAIDADCDGSADVTFSTSVFEVQPSACVVYRLTATNTGATVVKNARIDDAAPTFTRFFGNATVSAGNIVGGVAGTEGDISGGSNGVNIGVAPGGTLVLIFGVKLD